MPLKEQLKVLPDRPGVYLFKDDVARVIYVGKASNLRNRVLSYFSTKNQLSPKTEHLVSRINDLDAIVTDTEYEALVLENDLIKKYRPAFNVRLKDDKTFPTSR